VRLVLLAFCGALLTACSHSNGSIPSLVGRLASVTSREPVRSPGSERAPLGTVFQTNTSGKERILYQFSSKRADRGDGAHPYAGLTILNGKLYGTTFEGTSAGGSLAGTVFEVSPSGGERVLHIFGSGTDGTYPYAGLTVLGGMLYGTTYYGGTNNEGTAFEIDPKTAKERIIHNFGIGADGKNPTAALIVIKGALYGTTSGGGYSSGGVGTVFDLSASGAERVLYRFKGGGDGAFPHAGLVALDGRLYGTTTQGGGESGAGTIFEVSMAGKERVIHTFSGYPSDGSDAYGTLIELKGLLYGTTAGGGNACDGGCGTVFEVTTAGSERVLYNFTGGNDGAFPYGGLLAVGANLYGTTEAGGGTGCEYSGSGCGTIFKVTTSGSEQVIYRFKGGKDGANPYDALTDLNGLLYGTTYNGGASHGR
jgi:uncharacterized repeat protein (TIGR03803 family)